MTTAQHEVAALKRELGIWHTVAHALQMYAMVTMDGARVHKLIGLICDWSYAHRMGNGELDNDKLVAKALERLAAFRHEEAALNVAPRTQLVLEQLQRAIAGAPHPYSEIALNAKIEVERLGREVQDLQASQPAGDVVITTNAAGECVAVTRQNEDHQILSVIWERRGPPPNKEIWAAIGGPAPRS